MAESHGPRWSLVLEPMPPLPGEPPAHIRLRRLLKWAGRSLRLRCVSAAELPPPAPEGGPPCPRP